MRILDFFFTQSSIPPPRAQVYLAKWHETMVAVKLLLNTGVNLGDDLDAAAELALSLSNPILHNLQQVRKRYFYI